MGFLFCEMPVYSFGCELFSLKFVESFFFWILVFCQLNVLQVFVVCSDVPKFLILLCSNFFNIFLYKLHFCVFFKKILSYPVGIKSPIFSVKNFKVFPFILMSLICLK